jgi:signal transduction histidine kinase/methylmalonyl-CoA mutase cobalamin-binding subunit
MDSAQRTASRPSAISGEMAAWFRRFDWTKTPLGPPESWPESWRNAVRIILDSSFPTALAFGRELNYFYNDAFIPVGGPARHPSAIGKPVPVAWKEIWEPILQPRFEHTLSTGEPTGEEDLLIPLQRSGYLEETYITFSFAALRDDQDRPNGIFCTAYETTARVIADRQLNCLRALANQSSLAETAEEACQAAAATLREYPRDLPLAYIHLLDEDRKEDPRTLTDEAIAAAACPADMARPIAVAVRAMGGERTAAILVASPNPMRPLEESRKFFELVAAQLGTVISNARAKQHVRQRAQALAELDRAKTLFFSNISHELRTPLTLLLGPVGEVLGHNSLHSADRELLELAYRGGRRLLKLVNSLLEFSRIEAGRVEASYEPTDLSTTTADLVSVFRSAFERVGVALTIDCPCLPEPVYVDGDMWEKIVLNLVSNAFKFTFAGEVRVSLRLLEQEVELEVCDSGCGVAAEDLPRLFERFFRGRSTQSRTHEGSGIGLSLVQELVRLHGGTVEARSQQGQGTTITVRIPRGCAHLAPERIGAVRKLARSDTGPAPFVEEALGWIARSVESDSIDATPFAESGPVVRADSTVEYDNDAAERPLVLIVDDNADMREYLRRLLAKQWRVGAASDGVTALEEIEKRLPDLVIADIMMPNLDGFGLLRAMRTDSRYSSIPVMLLSARAGEEASAEALAAGADDYVIKPFSARELVARVEARLAQARVRAAERQGRAAAERANRARDEFFATLSHELRTPLMAVMAWTILLKRSELEPDAAAAVEIIERNARIQRRLVDDLLDMARIVTGKLRMDARTMSSLTGLIRIVVDSFLPVAQAKGITVETVLDMQAGPLHGDAERLQQVVWNLLSNAIRFTPRGGKIEVRCSRLGSWVEVLVRDSGRGIGAEAMPHLFERYWQGKVAEHPGQGLGLGLAIAQRIVLLHSGTIEAASEGEGRGATFRIRLPLHPVATPDGMKSTWHSDLPASANTRMVDAATAAAAFEATASRAGGPRPLSAEALSKRGPREAGTRDLSGGAPGRSLRVLLVDDHDAIAKACERLLASHGHVVIRTAGLHSAVDALEQDAFDLLICDLNLPDGSGLDLPARLRDLTARQSRPGTPPAIAISGRVFQDDVERCLAAGFAEHLAKPFDEQELLAAIGRATA